MNHAARLREIIANLETALDTEDVDDFAVVLEDLAQIVDEIEAADELSA